MVKVPIPSSKRSNLTEIFLILNEGEYTTQEILKISKMHSSTPNNISQFLKAIDEEGLLLIDKKHKHKKFKYTLNYNAIFNLVLKKLDSIFDKKTVKIKDKDGNPLDLPFNASSIWEHYGLKPAIKEYFTESFSTYLNKLYSDDLPKGANSSSKAPVSSIFEYIDHKKITFNILIDYYILSSYMHPIKSSSSNKVAIDNFIKWCKYYSNSKILHGVLIKEF